MNEKTRVYRHVARMDMDTIMAWAKQKEVNRYTALNAVKFYRRKWDRDFRYDAETPAQKKYVDTVVDYADNRISEILSATFHYS